MNSFKLPINAFDVIVLALVVLGIFRGRKKGFSEDALGMLKWILVVVLCGLLYAPVGEWLASLGTMSVTLLPAYIMAYIAIALVILSFFALIKHVIGGKLLGSDIFGRAEYYLGMCSSLVRFSCILVVLLALLNARYFSKEEVAADLAFQNDMYGSNYFPGLHSAQATVFQDSLSGPWIRDHLSFLLIEPTHPEHKQFKQRDFAFPQ